MRFLFPPSVFLLCSMVTACGDPPPELKTDAGTGGGNESLLVGTASTADGDGFVSLNEEPTPLTLIPGAQGGFHIFAFARMDSATAEALGERPIIKRVVRRKADQMLISRSEHRFRLEDVDPGETPGYAHEIERKIPPVFLCPTPIGVPVADEELELEFELAHPTSGYRLKSLVRFRPQCPSGDQENFCNTICRG